MSDTTIFIVIDINDFSISAFTTKNQVAEHINCHRNTLFPLKSKITYQNYIITPTILYKCKRGHK
jgi:hypothetical protein